MLAGALFLSDLMWGGDGQALYREVPWMLTADHINRAFQLCTLLDGIREAFRSGSAPQHVSPDDITRALAGENDRNFAGTVTVENTTHTEMARRILAKASKGRASDGMLDIPAARAPLPRLASFDSGC